MEVLFVDVNRAQVVELVELLGVLGEVANIGHYTQVDCRSCPSIGSAIVCQGVNVCVCRTVLCQYVSTDRSCCMIAWWTYVRLSRMAQHT